MTHYETQALSIEQVAIPAKKWWMVWCVHACGWRDAWVEFGIVLISLVSVGSDLVLLNCLLCHDHITAAGGRATVGGWSLLT